jgi:hypothetical protein
MSHSLLRRGKCGATAESNQVDMEIIRGLPIGKQRKTKIDDMILANIPLIFAKLEVYIALYGSVQFLYDDLISSGTVALTEAIQKLAGVDTPRDGGNCTAFIAQRILWAMCDTVEQFERQQIPKGYVPPKATVVDPTSLLEIRDLMLFCCQTEEDKIIFEMRERGSKDQEIADRLSISRRAVNLARHEMQQRYETLVRDAQ